MPVFNFDQSAFPLLTPQQTSPLGGVLSDAIAKRLAMAQAQKAEEEVPYAGEASYANALSKLAYANAVTPQFAAKLAGNKQIWSNMTPEQQASAVALASAPGTGGNAGTGQLNESIKRIMAIHDKQNKPSSDLFSSLTNWLGGNKQNEPRSIQPNMQQEAQPAKLPVVSPNLGEQPRAFQNEANYTAGQAQANATGTATGTQSAKQLDTAQSNSQNALNMDQLIDSALTEAKDVIFKGPLLGRFAEYGPKSAQLLKDTNAMAVSLANQLYGPNTTNAKDATATTLKLNIRDPEKAFNQFGEKLKAQNDRIKGQGTFYETMDSLGITNPRQRDQIWFDYNSEYPPYNYKAHKPIYENLGTDQNKFVDFISKDVKDSKSLNKRIESTLKLQSSENITVENLQHTAQINNISVPEVIKRLEAKGIKVPENLR